MAGRLHGKVAVVTGGCSGIGLATVRRFVEEGAHVVIGDLSDERGSEVEAELDGTTYVHVDVTDKDQVEALFRTAKQTYGSVDIAFNNAGISPPDDDSILDTDLDVWRRVQEVNLTSVYLCCKAALPYMLEQKSGSIINTASFVAVMGAATSQISYSASKGGLKLFVQSIAKELAPRGVRICSVAPGATRTPIQGTAEEPHDVSHEQIPAARWAEPVEIARAIAWLASDQAGYVVGTTLFVDGGLTLYPGTD